MRRWDSPAVIAVIVAMLYGGFVFMLVRPHNWDISRLVLAGGAGVDPHRVPKGLTVRPNIAGYDGAIFYRLAINPFTREQTAHGIGIDTPAYRQQRIGYPLLVWLLSLGHVEWIPALLCAVNVAALGAIGFASASLARALGHSAWWGVVAPMYPGFLLSLSHDTCEIVAAACVLGAVLAAFTNRHRIATLLLSYAVLTRETTLIVVFAFAIVSGLDLLRRRRPRLALSVFLVPIVVFLAWQVTLSMWWGVMPVRSVSPQWTAPLTGYLGFLRSVAPMRFHLQRLYFYECVFLAVVTITAAWAFIRAAIPAEWRVAWVASLALSLTLPLNVWTEDAGFLRILGEYFVLTCCMVLPAKTAVRSVALIVTIPMWLYLADHVTQYF